MLFTRRAVQVLELAQKEGSIVIEGTSIEGDVLLSVSDVCSCRFNVQYILFLGAGEYCVTELRNGQDNSCDSSVAILCFSLYFFDEPKSFRKASH